MKILVLSAALACGALAPAAAQEPGAVRESAEVALVEVPVRVIDRDGQPVRGLTAADFAVRDDGRAQAIVGFDAIDLAEKVSDGAGVPVHPAARRRFLILFDFSFSRPKSILVARKAARDFVLSGMSDRDLAAVATYSVEQGVRLLVTFSSDRAQLAHAIESLGLEARREAVDPLAFAFDASTLAAMAQARTSNRGQVEGLMETLQAYSAVNKARSDEYTRGRVRQLFQSFRELSQSLDAVEGRKDILYLSEGFSGRYLVGTNESDEERQSLLHGEIWKVDADRRFGSTPLRNELNEVGEWFRRSDCVVHAVDIAGIRAENDPESDPAPSGPRETESSLFDIAQATGGEVLRNTNDLAAQLDRVVQQTSLVYVLAFRPDGAGPEGAFHALKVKVSVHGARVLARSGYYDRRGFRNLSPLERRLLAANVIANEIPFDDIPIRVLALPFARGDESSVPVLVEVPGAPLLESDKGEKLGVEIYVYAVGPDGRLRDFFVRNISADLAQNRAKLMAAGVRYFGELRLPPGSYRIRTLVRNAATGRMGLNVTALTVPTFASGQPYLLAPVFLVGAGDWVAIRGSGREAGAAPANPFAALPGPGMTPAAVARVAPGDASQVCLVAYNVGASDARDLRLGSQILGEDGRPLETVKLAVLDAVAPDAEGKRMLLLSFPAPADLAPGRYGLRVFLQDGVGGPARQATTPFLVP